MKRATPIKRTSTKSAAPKNRIETPLSANGYSDEDFHRKVQEVAYQLYLERGCAHGYHVEDWMAAEQIVRDS